MNKKYLFIFLTIFVSCAIQKKDVPITNYFKELKFGTNGGFTNISHDYTLKNNGCIYKNEFDTLIYKSKLSKKQMHRLVEQMEACHLKNIVMQEYGNYNYSMEATFNSSPKKYNWTDKSSAPELKKIYQLLLKLIN